MTASERDLLEELGADAAEGEAELFAAEEEFEAEDMLEGEDALEAEDGLETEDPLEALEEEDALAMEDDLEAEDGAASEEAMLQAVSEALAAESEDEFLGKLVRGIAKVAKRVAPVIGKVARAAAPVLSVIPHPAAQIAAKVARVASQLRAEAEAAGAGPAAVVQQATEAAAELAARDMRARPVVVGLVARQLLQNRGATLSPAQRLRAVRQVAAAARAVTRAVGPRGLRALPRIAASVNRTAAAKGTPAPARPKVLLRTAQRVAARPTLASRLAQPSPRALRIVRRLGVGAGSRTFRMRGPVEITIRTL
jgi:hypothetical protein